LFLDTFLAITSLELAIGGMLPSTPILSTPMSWAAVLTFSAGAWSIITVVVVVTQPENRAWLFMESEWSRVTSTFSLLFQALVLAVFGISSLYSVSINLIDFSYIADYLPGIESWTTAHINGIDSSSYNDTRSAFYLVGEASLPANSVPQSYMVIFAHLLGMVSVQSGPEGCTYRGNLTIYVSTNFVFHHVLGLTLPWPHEVEHRTLPSDRSSHVRCTEQISQISELCCK